MFIMTNVCVEKDLVQVYDTKDNTNDTVRLSIVAEQIHQKKLKVYGLGRLSSMTRSDSIPVSYFGIYVCPNEAKEAMATFFQQHGLSRQEALAKVGLC